MPRVKPAAIRAIVEERVDPVLFYMSRDYVGDMAETVALLWPKRRRRAGGARRRDHLASARRSSGCGLPRGSRRRASLPRCSTISTPSGRFALLKLATGELRVGIYARLAKQALAQAFGLEVDAVEEVWHGLRPPYHRAVRLGRGPGRAADRRDVPVFRPFMLAHPLEETRVSLDDYAAEWKWDGIRVQLVHAGGETRLYSRAGDDISGQLSRCRRGLRARRACSTASCWCGARTRATPTCTAAARRASTRSSSGSAARTSARRCSATIPAFVRLYDILFDGDEDLRELPWSERRARLEAFAARLDPERFDLSALIEADELRGARGDSRRRPRRRDRRRDAEAARQPLCRAAAAPGLWYKWKRDPLTADCVLMYAAARPRQALVLLFRLHLRLLDARRANCCRSARPISASPTRS